MVVFLKQDIVDVNGFDEYLTTDEDGDFILFRLMFKGIIFLFVKTNHIIFIVNMKMNVFSKNNDSIEKWEHRILCL